MQVADELGAHTIAFPLVSAGIYRWPLEDAIDIAVDSVAGSVYHVAEVRLMAFDHDIHERITARLQRATT